MEFARWWAGNQGEGRARSQTAAFASLVDQTEIIEILEDADEEDARELCEEEGISPVPATLDGMKEALLVHFGVRSSSSSSPATQAAAGHAAPTPAQLEARGSLLEAAQHGSSGSLLNSAVLGLAKTKTWAGP